MLTRLAAGEEIGTSLVAGHHRSPRASSGSPITCSSPDASTLDAGAVRALARDGKSLLPIGVVAVDGQFERGEVVGCFDPDGREIARGLVNYSAQETARILRKPSSEIEAILGYVDEPELIHRDNLVLLAEQDLASDRRSRHARLARPLRWRLTCGAAERSTRGQRRRAAVHARQRAAARIDMPTKGGNAMALVDRVKNILLTPKTEWPKIAAETATTQSIFVGYVTDPRRDRADRDGDPRRRHRDNRCACSATRSRSVVTSSWR